MKTWDIDDKVDAAYEMRMQQVNHTIRTGGAASGGLTVRDYFAAKVLAAIADNYEHEPEPEFWGGVAEVAYAAADAMMEERGK